MIPEKYKYLKTIHQQLLNNWKKDNKPCIICGINPANEKDHLPPRVLYPKSLRNSKTEFFTFPVCSTCNRGSSDQDYLFSVLMALKLNESAYEKEKTPFNPDLLAIHEQVEEQLTNPKEAKRRQTLLSSFLSEDPIKGNSVITIDKLPVNETLTKIVKSIYWLHANGDILQNYNPGWWIIPSIDTSKDNFKKFLMGTYHELHWDQRFIYRYNIGLPNNGLGGLIFCSLHFYTEMKLGCGNNWLIYACPQKIAVDNKSLYELAISKLGTPYNLPKR